MVSAGAVGSWPGTDVAETLRIIRGELADIPGGAVNGIPYLPELPARGSSATLTARTAGALVDLSVDLQPQGWRLVDRPGRDSSRIGSARGEDLDLISEIFHGWSGRFAVTVRGPWSLAAQLWLPRGDRVLADAGALRDLQASLIEGVQIYLDDLARAIPAARLTLVVDEPTLHRVLAGTLPSDSGLRALPSPDETEVRASLRALATLLRERAVDTVLRVPADHAALRTAAGADPSGVSADVSRLDVAGWELVAPLVEAGGELWAGVITTDQVDGLRTPPQLARTATDTLLRAWGRVGLERRRADTVVLTPTGGLSTLTPAEAIAVVRATAEAAKILAETLDS